MRLNYPLFDFTRPENIFYFHIVSMLWSFTSLCTWKRESKSVITPARWSFLWGLNTLADYGFVSGYCCSLCVKRRMNPSDFSNGISETPAEWALWLVLIISALSSQFQEESDLMLWVKVEQHSGVTKKVLSAVAVSIFYCHLGFLAVPRGSERFNLAGLEKRKEGRYFFFFFYVLLNSVQLQFII